MTSGSSMAAMIVTGPWQSGRVWRSMLHTRLRRLRPRHGRAFLDNAVTSTLVFEGNGRIGEYIGGYTDWLRQRQNKPTPKTESLAKAQRPATAPSAQKPRTKSRKLSI
jgi:hypothetical protein